MLRKIVAIKNVGRFRNSASGGDTSLARHTVIHGANGYGKTTICTILRALAKADADLVLGRATLGVTELPDIHLLMESGNARFDGRAWTQAIPTSLSSTASSSARMFIRATSSTPTRNGAFTV